MLNPESELEYNLENCSWIILRLELANLIAEFVNDNDIVGLLDT